MNFKWSSHYMYTVQCAWYSIFFLQVNFGCHCTYMYSCSYNNRKHGWFVDWSQWKSAETKICLCKRVRVEASNTNSVLTARQQRSNIRLYMNTVIISKLQPTVTGRASALQPVAGWNCLSGVSTQVHVHVQYSMSYYYKLHLEHIFPVLSCSDTHMMTSGTPHYTSQYWQKIIKWHS